MMQITSQQYNTKIKEGNPAPHVHLWLILKQNTPSCSQLSVYNWVIITLMAIEMVTLTTTLPQRPCSPSAGSKSGCYTPSVRLQQEDPLYLNAHRALFEDLRGVTWVAGKCPEGHVRQTSSRKAVLEWKSGCCGEDQSRTRLGPFSSVHYQQCVCVCVCLIWCHYVCVWSDS